MTLPVPTFDSDPVTMSRPAFDLFFNGFARQRTPHFLTPGIIKRGVFEPEEAQRILLVDKFLSRRWP
jgi:hypothetical protein